MRKFLLASAATVAMTGAAAAAGLEPQLGSTSHQLYNRSEPGKAVVRLDGYFFFAAGVSSNTNDKATTVVGGVRRTGKVDAYGLISTFRFFPAFDAQTPGGLRYGALAEIRSNNNTGGASGGVGTGGQRGTNTLFVNRTRGYVGGDAWGTVLFGSTDGPAATMRVGTFEGQIADGGWNGWAPILARGVNPYQFAIGGGYEYSSQRVIYLSPTFSGFRFGASFAPSSASNQSGDGNNLIAGGIGQGGGARISTSLVPFAAGAGDFNRFRNQFQVAANYAGTFGGVGVAAHAAYIGSGAVKSAIAGANPNGGTLTTARGQSIVAAGATVSYMGFSVGGYMNTGTFNGNSNLSIAGEKNSTVYTVGAAYETGPWAVGAHYMAASTNGVFGNRAQRHDTGFSVGLRYAYAPGALVMLEAVSGTAKERGVNLSNDTTLAPGTSKSINATAVILGNSWRW